MGHLFGGLRNRLVLNNHALRICVVHLLVYIYIYVTIKKPYYFLYKSEGISCGEFSATMMLGENFSP